MLSGPLRHAGGRPQQIQPPARPGHAVHQGGGEVDAGHPLLQRPAQNFGGVDHTDAVREDQIRPGQNPGKFRVLGRPLNDLRVGSNRQVGARLIQKGHGPVRRFCQGHIVKGHAQHVYPHGSRSSRGTPPGHTCP